MWTPQVFMWDFEKCTIERNYPLKTVVYDSTNAFYACIVFLLRVIERVAPRQYRRLSSLGLMRGAYRIKSGQFASVYMNCQGVGQD
jgi:hypothetical protein